MLHLTAVPCVPPQFNISKLQLLEAEKARIRRDFERRESQITVKKKVDQSKQLNAARLKVLQAREDAVQSLLREGQMQLAALSRDPGSYNSLIVDLLAQGFATIKEPKVKVRCRREDEALVRQALPSAQQRFTTSSDGVAAPEADVDTDNYLPAGPTGGVQDDEIQYCCGGVVVTSFDGKIVCSNTLDDRLHISYTQNLPVIRQLLFEN